MIIVCDLKHVLEYKEIEIFSRKKEIEINKDANGKET